MTPEILEAKRTLLALLLKEDSNKLTNNEVDIMYALSQDKQIRGLIKKNIKKNEGDNEDTQG